MLHSAAPTDTAGYWLKGRALNANIDRSEDSLFDAVEAISGSEWFGQTVSPDAHAARFYLLNHTAMEIAKGKDLLEPLSPDELAVMKAYATVGSDIAIRLFWYVLLITTREARHNNSSASPSKVAAILKDVQKSYPEATAMKIATMFEFTKTCPDTSSILQHLMQPETKEFPLGQFCKMLSSLYYRCSWGSMYGGPKWGAIADALVSFVSGEWSAGIFADTAFTLAHNTAPIFNKGMLYTGPSHSFIQLLDVQRAGMVPQWLSHYGTQFHDEVYTMCRAVKPGLFEGDVDWNQVELLGAVGSYGHMKPKTPPKPPKGCANHKIAIDPANNVWVLEGRAA